MPRRAIQRAVAPCRVAGVTQYIANATHAVYLFELMIAYKVTPAEFRWWLRATEYWDDFFDRYGHKLVGFMAYEDEETQSLFKSDRNAWRIRAHAAYQARTYNLKAPEAVKKLCRRAGLPR